MKLFTKYSQRYLSSFSVFCMDMILSTMAALISLLLIYYEILPIKTNSNFALSWLCVSFVASAISYYFSKTYLIIIRHLSLRDMPNFLVAVFIKAAILVSFMWWSYYRKTALAYIMVIATMDITLTFCFLIFMRVAMLLVYNRVNRIKPSGLSRQNILIYGTSNHAVSITKRLASARQFKIMGFLTTETQLQNYRIADTPIFQFETKGNIEYFRNKYGVDAILFANELDAQKEQERLVQYALDCGLKLLVAPAVDEIVNGKINRNGIREVKIEDLLGREEIKISMDAIISNFQDKVVLVTGAAGSIGSELCRQLAGFGVKKLILFDNAETPTHNIRLELEDTYPQLDFVPIIGDVRDKARLDYVFRSYHPQIVFHAAAYKHVPLMEENPCEAVHVNVTGSHYIANNCVKYGVEKMIMISTDKAVNPTNIMGCTKRLAEIYVQSLGLSHKSPCKFITTRFGNVLGSNGSVIPRFRAQIENGGPVTVTDPRITRFFMTIPEACRLVMEAATMGNGNEIFVFDMGKSVKIDDLARKMISLAGLTIGKDIKIEYTGLRPGEKLYEEVLANDENTLPTSHDRIRVAKVREYNYEEAHNMVNQLTCLSASMEIDNMVRLMKTVVPEFVSKNSQFEKFDNK